MAASGRDVQSANCALTSGPRRTLEQSQADPPDPRPRPPNHVLMVATVAAGISGAGRSAKQNLLYAEATEGVNAYGVTRHRHMPEIEQGLSDAAGKPVRIRCGGACGGVEAVGGGGGVGAVVVQMLWSCALFMAVGMRGHAPAAGASRT
jgi:hypothetical protein